MLDFSKQNQSTQIKFFKMLSFSKYGVFKIEILKQQNSRIKDFFKIKALHNWRLIHSNQSLSSGWRLQTHFGAHLESWNVCWDL